MRDLWWQEQGLASASNAREEARRGGVRPIPGAKSSSTRTEAGVAIDDGCVSQAVGSHLASTYSLRLKLHPIFHSCHPHPSSPQPPPTPQRFDRLPSLSIVASPSSHPTAVRPLGLPMHPPLSLLPPHSGSTACHPLRSPLPLWLLPLSLD